MTDDGLILQSVNVDDIGKADENVIASVSVSKALRLKDLTQVSDPITCPKGSLYLYLNLILDLVDYQRIDLVYEAGFQILGVDGIWRHDSSQTFDMSDQKFLQLGKAAEDFIRDVPTRSKPVWWLVRSGGLDNQTFRGYFTCKTSMSVGFEIKCVGE